VDHIDHLLDPPLFWASEVVNKLLLCVVEKQLVMAMNEVRASQVVDELLLCVVEMQLVMAMNEVLPL
jgi:hypothetical protein